MPLPKYPYYPRKNRRCNAVMSTRQKLWQAMRILRRFDAAQLAATAETTTETARKLISALKQYGVVMHAGNTNYKLQRDLGPHAPSLRSDKTLYDHNTKKILTITKE